MVDLPEFDTGEYEGSQFLITGGSATLTISIANQQPFVIQFSRIRWHQFTAMYNCTADMIKDAYFRLHEVVPSTRLNKFLASDTAVSKAYRELHHYRIFLDETGCHEVFAESARVGA